MKDDPIVAEVRAIRDDLARQWAMISRKSFGNYGNNSPARGGSTFAIRPVGSSQRRISKRSVLTQRAAVDPSSAYFVSRHWEGVNERRDQAAAKAGFEYLYDKPYEDWGIVRVVVRFTVERLSPHPTLGIEANDELIDHLAQMKTMYDGQQHSSTIILEHLNTSGVHQAYREARTSFTALTPWPSDLICAEGRYVEGEANTGTEPRVGAFIGPEFGTVARPDLVAASSEAADADFDVLISCTTRTDGLVRNQAVSCPIRGA